MVGNDSFRGILIWECVKTWTPAPEPTPGDDADSELGGGAGPEDSLAPQALASVIDGADVSLGLAGRRSVPLSAADQQQRLDALAQAATGVLQGDLSEAGTAAAQLTATYRDVAVSTLPKGDQRTVTTQLTTVKIDSPLEAKVVGAVAGQTRTDLTQALSVIDTPRASAVGAALADARVQDLLADTVPANVAQSAHLALTAGDLPSVAGILRTAAPVNAVEYKIADALSKGDLAKARSLASGAWSFKSSIVAMSLSELLQAQGQTATSAQIAAAKALVDGKLKAGAWYAFNKSAVQKCPTSGCAWLGSAASS